MSAGKVLRDVVDALRGSASYSLHPAAFTSSVYPLDLEFTLEQESLYYMPKDASGIPIRRYRSVGAQYSPTRVAAYGLAHYNRYMATGDARSRDTFLRVSDWFMASADGMWRYAFDWGELRAPWISCMAQGEGISVLVRAFRLTGDGSYLAQAVRATIPFTKAITQGGVRSFIDGKHVFLEEYPASKPRHTLNGFLYALIGLLDLAELDPDSVVALRLDDLICTLEAEWPRWDLHGWSAYDLHRAEDGLRNPATAGYHRVHITLLSYIAHNRSSEALWECVDAWKAGYESRRLRFWAVIGKIRYRMRFRPQR